VDLDRKGGAGMLNDRAQTAVLKPQVFGLKKNRVLGEKIAFARSDLTANEREKAGKCTNEPEMAWMGLGRKQ
jgi:hypothetical protein